MYDTFISYRRAGGAEIAARLYDFLKLKGFDPFYDMTGMRAGRFDEQLRDRILQAENFILILSVGALDRCNELSDWVREEVKTAIDYNLNIVVFQEEGFKYPSDLPEEISSISMYQAILYDKTTVSARLEQLPAMLKYKNDRFASFETGKEISGRKIKFSGEYITRGQ